MALILSVPTVTRVRLLDPAVQSRPHADYREPKHTTYCNMKEHGGSVRGWINIYHSIDDIWRSYHHHIVFPM